MKTEVIKQLATWVFAIVLTVVVYAGSGKLMDAYEANPWLVRIITTVIMAAVSLALIGPKAKAMNRIPAWLIPVLFYFLITFFTT